MFIHFQAENRITDMALNTQHIVRLKEYVRKSDDGVEPNRFVVEYLAGNDVEETVCIGDFKTKVKELNQAIQSI